MSIFFVNTQDAQISNAFLATLGAAPGSTFLAQIKAAGLIPSVQAMINATGSSTAAALSTKVATNLGLTGTALTGGTAYLDSVTFAGASSTWAANLMSTLDLFSTLQSDATYGSAATAYLARVNSAVSYSVVATNNSTDLPTLAAAVGSAGSTGGGSTFTLTTNIDSATASNFVGTYDDGDLPASSLNPGDTFVGELGNNSLRIVDISGLGGDAANVLAGVTLTNIQNVTVQAILGANNDYDFAGITGVTSVTSLNSGAVDAAAGDVTVGFTNLANGTQVIAAGAGTVNLSLVGFTMLNAATPLNVGFAGGVNGTTVANQNVSTATAATITSSGGVNGTTVLGVAAANTVDFNTTAINTLTVNAASNLRVALTNTDYAAAGMSLTVAGAATNVNLGNQGVYKTINASGLTNGGVTVNASNTLSSFIGGNGNDSLTGAATISATATINGGAGTDTVAATLVNAGNGARFTSFEVLSLTAAAGNAFDASILTNSVLTGTSAGDIGGNLTVSNLVMGGGGFDHTITASSAADTLTLGFTSASVSGTTDAVNFRFNNATAAGAVDAGTIAIGGVETANFRSDGIAGSLNEVILTGTALKTVTITGSQAFEYSTTAQASFGGALTSSLTLIDGSAATGDLIITDLGVAATINAAGLTILGGSGNDTITVATSPQGNLAGTATNQFGGDTVTTGEGADIVNIGAATVLSVTSSAFTTITDIAAGDSIISTGETFGAFIQTAVNVSAATSLTDAFTIAEASATEDDITHFVFAGNTFVFFGDNTDGFGVGDLAVRLTGVVDLTASTLIAGANGGLLIA